MQFRLLFAVIAFVSFVFVIASYTNAQESSQDTPSADDSTTIQEKYPLLFWQGSNAEGGERLRGQVESPNLKTIKAKLEQLDWSGEASSEPYLGICLDRYNLLRIELAEAKDKKRAMVAILRTAPFMQPGETSDKAVFFMNTASRPLKDDGHALELLKSYLKLHDKKVRELDSLTEWDTTNGKLPSPYLSR